ncbi:MAG: 2-succinyl-6-hydroxy-2,4-cyclohexadiene-1-carboxylate synthase [Ignavibacteriaceae bacterium]|nr:2-succinyl-6-hydroxy-2,4-cyclohexadiene-1-carboxylate synthase [Ignavibacteriaceae bacterium]
MFIKYLDIQLNIENIINNEASGDSVFFLHGFTGCANDWIPIVSSLNKSYNYYLVDLVGHGKSDSPKEGYNYSIDSIVNQLQEIILSLCNKKIILTGYSFGGRIALNFALKNGAMLKGLILESSTWGISDEQLREDRVNQDELLAAFIENNPIEKFIDYWMNLELFNTQRRFSNKIRNLIREKKLENNTIGLANSLRYSGTGKMIPLYDYVKDIFVKTLLITGELDSKFTDINNSMVKFFPNAEHLIIKNAGHNTHLEEPHKFIEAVNKFLRVI